MVVADFLEFYHIPYEEEFLVPGTSYYADMFVGGNELIEVFGDYWHANPCVYKENDIVSYPFGKIKA